MKEKRYQPGETIVLREIWDGKIWTARPMIIVQDTPELLALHIPPQTIWKHHRGLTSNHISALERKNKEWTLQDAVWGHLAAFIKIIIPGEMYSVLLFRNANGTLRRWYINLESKMKRHGTYFDYTDLILDLIIEPDLKHWNWEDEDELQEAVDLGLISPEQNRALYAKGIEVRDLIMSGKSIFDGWEKWRPDPTWKVPVFPDGWD